MSDEYGSSGSGFGGSLVSESLDSKDVQPNNTQNDDTTSQGGYGGSGDSFSQPKQRGSDASSQGQLNVGEANNTGGSHTQRTAGDLNERGEGSGLSDALNPYGPSSDAAPASKQSGRRGDMFESGPGASMDRDVGA